MYNAHVISIVFEGGVQNEKNLSAQKEAKKRRTRLQKENGNKERTQGFVPPSREGKSTAFLLTKAPSKGADFFLIKLTGFKMQYTCSLKKNRDFRRMFSRGKSRVSRPLVLYVSRNSLGYSRLGISAGVKLGGAVKRNRVRRRIREAYRINEASFKPGYDIIVVARTRAMFSDFSEICDSLLSLADALGIRKNALL